MDSLRFEKSKSKSKNSTEQRNSLGVFPVGKYYLPGRISSSGFDRLGYVDSLDEKGLIISSPKRKSFYDKFRKSNYDTDELYDVTESRNYDPLGSYTGRPINLYEVPVQDADDL